MSWKELRLYSLSGGGVGSPSKVFERRRKIQLEALEYLPRITFRNVRVR